jgi:hypothetical protein
MHVTKTEQWFLVGGAIFLGLLMISQVLVRPTMDRISTLRRVVTDKRANLSQLQAKSQEYQLLKTEVARLRAVIEQQGGGRRILSTLERIREDCGLSDNVVSLKPTTTAINDEYQETTIEVRLDGITLAQLIQFLSQIDSLELAGGIRALEVRHADRSPNLLKATVQVATVSRIG